MSESNNNISQQALLVSLSFGLPRQSRQLPKEAKKIESDNHAQHGVARVSIFYFQQEVAGKTNDALYELKQHFNAWRSEHNRLSRPWDNANTRLLPAKLIPAYLDMKSKFEEATPEKIANFVDAYPDWQVTAPQRMGALFDAADFPALAECRDRIEYGVAMIPLPAAEQWKRISIISPELAQSMETTTNERIAKAVEEARKQTWVDLITPVEKIVSTLSKDKPKFFESLIGNLNDILTLAPSFNLANDAEMTAFIVETKATLATISVDDLRSDPELRQQTLTNAKDLLARFGALGIRKFA